MMSYAQYVRSHKKKKRSGKKKKASSRGSSHSLFKIAARDTGYKAAKRAKNKADARAKRAWKKAQARAKKKLRRMKKC